MSLTSGVFPHPRASSGWWWIYYTISNPEDFHKAVQQNNPVVLMFSADNEPSKVMKKPFRSMASAKKKQAVFCLVDIDKLKRGNIAEQYRVEALPTFVLIKDRLEAGRVVGAKVDELKTTIENNI